ncbi:MAG: hypothetical protein ACI4KI_04935 [Candidatus Fimenecus sp.]
MIFKNKKSTEKAAETRKKIEKMSAEISEIWNGEHEESPIDVNGSYTGNPIGFEQPEQDPDDL